MSRIEIVVPNTITISVWAQCRQRRLCFCLIPLKRVAPSKEAGRAALVGAAKSNAKCALSFRAQPRRTDRLPFSLKQLRCPECGAAETLNCHSKLYGNDPSASDGKAQSSRSCPAGVGACSRIMTRAEKPHLWLIAAAWPVGSSCLTQSPISEKGRFAERAVGIGIDA